MLSMKKIFDHDSDTLQKSEEIVNCSNLDIFQVITDFNAIKPIDYRNYKGILKQLLMRPETLCRYHLLPPALYYYSNLQGSPHIGPDLHYSIFVFIELALLMQ
ncbi:MAG: hypothetical protein ACR2HF_02575, partial [Methylococcaceae bacterium]